MTFVKNFRSKMALKIDFVHDFINDLKPQILQKYHPTSDSSRCHLNFEQREKLKEYFEEDRFLVKF